MLKRMIDGKPTQPLIRLAVGEKNVAFLRYSGQVDAFDRRGTVGRVQSAPSPASSVSSVPCIIVHRISHSD